MSEQTLGQNEPPSHHGGLENLDIEYNYSIDEFDGAIPADLEGTFFRNGPGRQRIGETKYGRPIIVRTFDPAMPFEDAIRLLMVSFDSTIRSNLAVDLPLDLSIHERDAYRVGRQQRIEADDPYFRRISEQWSLSLREAVNRLPPFQFEQNDTGEAR